MKALLLALLVTGVFWQSVFARPRSDLDMELVENAKKEKKLAFYTTMDLPQTIEVIRDFAQKYPFLDLELHPLEADTLVKRIHDEARSGISTWDVLLGWWFISVLIGSEPGRLLPFASTGSGQRRIERQRRLLVRLLHQPLRARLQHNFSERR